MMWTPWHFQSDANSATKAGPVICEVPTAFSSIVIRGTHDEKGCPSTKVLNEYAHECAYLFIAAPKLLAALEAIVENESLVVVGTLRTQNLFDEAREAIAEAKGETA